MGTLDELLGGSGQVGRLQGFLRRYEQGAAADGVSDQEPLDYRQAAGEAFRRMSPADREQLGEQLQQGARAHRVNLGGVLANPAARAASGGIAAMVVRQVQQHR